MGERWQRSKERLKRVKVRRLSEKRKGEGLSGKLRRKKRIQGEEGDEK